MERKNKINLIILSVICSFFMLSAFFFYIGRQNEKKDRRAVEKEFQKVVLERENLTKITIGLEEIQNELELKLKDSEEREKGLLSELEEEKKMSNQLIAKIAEKETEIGKFKSETETQKKMYAKTAKKLGLLEKTYNDLKSMFEGLLVEKKESKEKIEELDEKLKDLSKEEALTPLGTIVIKE